MPWWVGQRFLWARRIHIRDFNMDVPKLHKYCFEVSSLEIEKQAKKAIGTWAMSKREFT